MPGGRRRAAKPPGDSTKTAPGPQKDEDADAKPVAVVQVPTLSLGQADALFMRRCERLRLQYAVLGKGEWWWIMDDSLALVSSHLKDHGYCVIDGFLSDVEATQLRCEVMAAHTAGQLRPAGLVNCKLPSADDNYKDKATRGDLVGWFDSDGWPHGRQLGSFLVKLGTLVSELTPLVPELSRIDSRSKAMVACYPGSGARYVKHVDNDGKHPLCSRRVLTALVYLNPDWQDGDGGELAIYEIDGQVEKKVVQPKGNRVLLFWSDARTPHEVRPSLKMRYSTTVWLLQTETGPCTETDDTDGKAVAESEPTCHDTVPPPPPSQDTEADYVAGPVNHEWRGMPDLASWELHVEIAGEPECPALDVSDTHVRLVDASGSLLLHAPLPRRCAEPQAPKWSRKRRTLTVFFHACEANSPPDTSNGVSE